MKNLCEWDKKEIEKNLSVLVPLVLKPKYICPKCARVASDQDILCKSRKLKK